MARTEIRHSIEGGTKRDLGEYALIWCPGCESYHAFRIRLPHQMTEHEKAGAGNLWSWNGDDEKPTFKKSLKCTWIDKEGREQVCHSNVTDGRIEYAPDTTHKLKGQTVDLSEIDLSSWSRGKS